MRGNIQQIHACNGSNFVGTIRKMKNSFHMMDYKHMQKDLKMVGLGWLNLEKNPRTATHMDGIWGCWMWTARLVLYAHLQKKGCNLQKKTGWPVSCYNIHLNKSLCYLKTNGNWNNQWFSIITTQFTSDEIKNHDIIKRTFPAADIHSRKQ